MLWQKKVIVKIGEKENSIGVFICHGTLLICLFRYSFPSGSCTLLRYITAPDFRAAFTNPDKIFSLPPRLRFILLS